MTTNYEEPKRWPPPSWTPHPGPPPSWIAPTWWDKGPDDAAQAARDAIALSVRVGARMREIAGNNSVLFLRPQIPALFPDEAERLEAYRLLDLAALIKRRVRSNGTMQSTTQQRGY